jgi:hypothetical protein
MNIRAFPAFLQYRRTGAAIEAHYRFLAWFVPMIEKLLKSQKFTIGDRIQTIALDVLEALIGFVSICVLRLEPRSMDIAVVR